MQLGGIGCAGEKPDFQRTTACTHAASFLMRFDQNVVEN